MTWSRVDQLQGHAVAVTGAASGIGLAITAGLASCGASVVAIDRQMSPALAELGASASNVDAVLAEVTSEPEIDESIGLLATRGTVLGVVHCAGIQLASDARVADLEMAEWKRTIEVNLTGAYLVSRAAVRTMLGAGVHGSIVLCGSPTAIRGSSNEYSAYSSSKGGVHALTRVLAMSYGPNHIRANTLVPGPTETALTDRIFADPQVRAGLTMRVPMGRLGVPQDYVGPAIFLLSQDSAFMTGCELVVDGGFTIT